MNYDYNAFKIVTSYIHHSELKNIVGFYQNNEYINI